MGFLTTAMVALAMATTVTDYIMSYCCLSLSPHYNMLKYQPTMDFGDFRMAKEVVKERHANDYDPRKHKATSVSQAISDAAEGVKDILDKDMLLPIICSFEQRLNRLDGVDVENVEDVEGGAVTKAKSKLKEGY